MIRKRFLMKMLNKKTILIALTGVVALGGIIAGLAIFVKIYYHGVFPLNTIVAGVEISHKTTTEAEKLIREATEEFSKEKITINYKNKSGKFSPEELGVTWLIKDTLGAVTGREQGLIVEVYEDRLLNSLDSVFKFRELEAKPATFYFDEKNSLTISEEKAGESIKKEDLIVELKKLTGELQAGEIGIATEAQKPLITKAELEEKQEEMKEVLNRKITLVDPIYNDDWDIYLRDHLDWIEFSVKQKVQAPYFNEMVFDEPLSGGGAELKGEKIVAITIKKDPLSAYVDAEISKWLDRPAEDVKIFFNEEGKITAEGKGVNGRKVQREFLRQGIELAIANNINEVPIPVIEIPASYNIAEEIQAIGIKERISQGHTSYYGSPANRVHNIKTGAERFDGVLIQPGESFSFNTTLGPVDGSTGYRKELVIKPEGTLPEFGGGLCQVSTTMYRAILFAGLPVIDRAPHSYAVSYYSQILGHGLDATIYLGGQDLQFTNDTGYPILVHTYVIDDYELYFDFYGTADGRTVELEGPKIYGHTSPGPTEYIETTQIGPGETKQVEKAHGGFSADWLYHLTDATGKKTTTILHSGYKAVPNKIWVGQGSLPENAPTVTPTPAQSPQEFATP